MLMPWLKKAKPRWLTATNHEEAMFASHTYMKYVYCPDEDISDDNKKIIHTIKCQETGEIIWHDTHHSPYSYMSRQEFIDYVDMKLHAENKSAWFTAHRWAAYNAYPTPNQSLGAPHGMPWYAAWFLSRWIWTAVVCIFFPFFLAPRRAYRKPRVTISLLNIKTRKGICNAR